MPRDWRVGFTQFVGVWAIVSQAALLVQLISVYRTKEVSGLSLVAFAIMLVSQVVWFTYGMWAKPERDWPLATSAALAFALSLAIIVGIIAYQRS